MVSNPSGVRRLLFVATTLEVGGAERQLLHAVRVLVSEGQDVVVAAASADGGVGATLRSMGVDVIALDGTTPPARALSVASLARRYRPELVQSAHFSSNLYAVIGAAAVGAPSVGAVRNSLESSVRSLGRWGIPSLRLPSVLAVNSRGAREAAISMGIDPEHVLLLPNVCIPWVKRSAAAESALVVTVSRLVPAKRIDRAFRVLRSASIARGGAITWAIAGEGPMVERVAAMARSGEADRIEVRLMGKISGVESLLAEGALLLHTSDVEGTPNAVLEAMASGLPVVATRVGGTSEVVEDGRTGYLHEPADEDGLADSVATLLGSPDLRSRMGDAGLSRLADIASEDRMARALRSVHQQALMGASR